MCAQIFLIFLRAMTMTPVQGQAPEPKVVSGVGFDADHLASESSGKYGVIVLTGSGGGKANDTASRIAEMGCEVLSLAYFDRDQSELVPQTLELIPLEYFDAPKNG